MKITFTAKKRSLITCALLLFFFGSLNAQNVPIELVRLELSGQSYTDEIVVYTDSGATFAFDGQYDAIKIPNFLPGPTFASISSDPMKLHINAIPPGTTTSTVPLSLVVGVNGGYTITATELTGFVSGADVIFDDSLLQVSQSLITNPTYSFTFNENDPDSGRFYLNFVPGTVTSYEDVKAGKDYELVVLSPNEIQLNLGKNIGDLKGINMFDLRGSELSVTVSGENGTHLIRPQVDIPFGVYVIQISTSAGVFNEKLLIWNN